MLGKSLAMKHVYHLVDKVAPSDVSVLITGETGTGKERIAAAVHDASYRKRKAFVVQNCACLPESLLESELFGYRKGAFTGADRDRPGLFDMADGGTLFLDEIGDMALGLQSKLLRVLQEGEVRPLGSTALHRVDVRIVAATHHDLLELVQTGRFRKDLYYRLSHFPIELPPLRARGNDVEVLAKHFANEMCAALQRPLCRWLPSALQMLQRYSFPGNVRELRSVVERAVLLCEDGVLAPAHFALRFEHAEAIAEPLSLRERMEHFERNVVRACLAKHNGNQTRAAQELGVCRRTLLYRLDRLGLKPAGRTGSHLLEDLQ